MRPQIICHMISSLDGRLDPEHWTDAADASITDLVEKHYETAAKKLQG